MSFTIKDIQGKGKLGFLCIIQISYKWDIPSRRVSLVGSLSPLFSLIRSKPTQLGVSWFWPISFKIGFPILERNVNHNFFMAWRNEPHFLFPHLHSNTLSFKFLYYILQNTKNQILWKNPKNQIICENSKNINFCVVVIFILLFSKSIDHCNKYM